MKLRCDCQTHILEVKDMSYKDFKTVWVGIYDIYSPKTGRKYKKPKLLSDVVIMDNYYPKELTKLTNFMKKYQERKK